MPAVRVLPDALVDQIAAGEVVERPASVVKELVENAFDSGATRVTVAIEGGGVARVSVLDDGCGMAPDDALLALRRHATSKIATEADLARIGTLGFRGEALPSIASVSRLVLTTSPDRSGLGTEVVADRGAAPRAAPARHAKGTRVVVEDLFGNVPARRKFLKGADAEQRAVVRVATALALSRPGLAFALRSGARDLLDLPPANDAAVRFLEVMGEAAGPEVLPVSASGPGLRLRGAVTRPDVSFASRTYQWLFVDGRLARDGTVAHAVQLAAREVLDGDRHPAFVLFLSLDPGLCDVNVHPQKLEVRFREPSAVHALVHRTLAAALRGARGAVAVPAAAFAGPVAPPYEEGPATAAAALAETLGLWGRPAESPPPRPGLLVPPAEAQPAAGSYGGAAVPSASPLGDLRLLGQYRDSFLVAEDASGLVLVDQHVAHERVRYERIRDALDGRPLVSQKLLLPVTFEATPEEAALLERAEPLLAAAGFAVQELSGRLFVVTEVPVEGAPDDVAAFVRDFLARTGASVDSGAGAFPEGSNRMKDALAASLACRGAVTVNTPLAPQAAARLLADLARCRDPWACPHGRPIFLTFAHADLERRFGRRS